MVLVALLVLDHWPGGTDLGQAKNQTFDMDSPVDGDLRGDSRRAIYKFLAACMSKEFERSAARMPHLACLGLTPIAKREDGL